MSACPRSFARVPTGALRRLGNGRQRDSSGLSVAPFVANAPSRGLVQSPPDFRAGALAVSLSGDRPFGPTGGFCCSGDDRSRHRDRPRKVCRSHIDATARGHARCPSTPPGCSGSAGKTVLLKTSNRRRVLPSPRSLRLGSGKSEPAAMVAIR
jgi:hypothetical protein